mgnify:CR=1 FL=1
MRLRLLLDQDTERQLARSLRNAGHDVRRVVTTAALGDGTPDSEIASFAITHDRIIVTHDSDFARFDSTVHVGVSHVPDQRLPAHEIGEIIERICAVYPERAALPAIVYLNSEWLG